MPRGGPEKALPRFGVAGDYGLVFMQANGSEGLLKVGVGTFKSWRQDFFSVFFFLLTIMNDVC